MSKIEHQGEHIRLHNSLDELISDFYKATKKSLRETSIMELLAWSFEQTLNPVETPESLVYED